MKEYLSIAVSVISGLLIPVFWSLITTHFRSKQNAKDIKDMNAELKELKKDVSETNINVVKINVTTDHTKEQVDKLVDLFSQHIVNK